MYAGSFPEALRLYGLCKAMRWNHLPVAGGLYDQHPKLIDSFQIIMEEEARVEARKRETDKRSKSAKKAGRK